MNLKSITILLLAGIILFSCQPAPSSKEMDNNNSNNSEQPATTNNSQANQQSSVSDTNSDNLQPASTPAFDWQGHRGARGLVPENTISSFIKALEYPSITTLELDVVISKDSQVVVSHEPWMSHQICNKPNGRPVSEDEEGLYNIWEMNYSQIKQFDCGSRGNEKFPSQEKVKAYKPLLRDVVYAVDNYCKANGRALPNFNIEIKNREEWIMKKTPVTFVFASILLKEIETLKIQERSCIQSFDRKSLISVKRINPNITTAFLVEAAKGVMTNITTLGYKPEIYSPYYKMVTKNVVDQAHKMGMKVIPWTVNEEASMKALVQMGVDGIITDYPDKIRPVKAILKMD
ncbi:MAG: glycerophosphodiester phosphodiesterase [Saprospiraceae bacterium]|nr:glycerophosphodiester phosphodiesterase [Saprospiraceae bacterium]